MRGFRKQDTLTLEFNFLESSLLRRALVEIIRNYNIKPEALDPEIARYWYSTRGCKNARMSEEEIRDWIAALHAGKTAHLEKLEQWHKGLSGQKSGPYQLNLTMEEGHTLLTVLNDHRLLTAGRYAIGQDEMDCHSEEELNHLSPEQQAGLVSIHLLAWIIEELLRLLSPEAASWMETLSEEGPKPS
jgi:hypothetical protein